jgi:hypothetical protein
MCPVYKTLQLRNVRQMDRVRNNLDSSPVKLTPAVNVSFFFFITEEEAK